MHACVFVCVALYKLILFEFFLLILFKPVRDPSIWSTLIYLFNFLLFSSSSKQFQVFNLCFLIKASQIADAKVHRSTSYRIATARHQVATCGEADQPPDT